MANPFVHVELQTTDLKKARDFYSKLFDWKLEDTQVPGFGTYTMIGVGEGTGGGMMAAQTPGVPSFWLSYVNVSDVASATGRRSWSTPRRCPTWGNSASSPTPPARRSDCGKRRASEPMIRGCSARTFSVPGDDTPGHWPPSVSGRPAARPRLERREAIGSRLPDPSWW